MSLLDTGESLSPELLDSCDVLIGYKTCFVLSADDMHPKLISVWFVWVPQYKLVQYVEDLNDINLFIHNTGLIEDEKLSLNNGKHF